MIIAISIYTILLNIVIGQTLGQSKDNSIYIHVPLTDYPDAVCLDGSPGHYQISKNIQYVNNTQILITIEGGMSCSQYNMIQTLHYCYDYTRDPNYGSSKKHKKYVRKPYLGIHSGQEQYNPHFYNWTKVYIFYCSGLLHQASRATPIFYKDTNMYFRGSEIIRAVFDDLDKKYGLFTKYKLIVLHGVSGGSFASLNYGNYLQSKCKGKVKILADSPFSIDTMNLQTNLQYWKARAHTKYQISKQIGLKQCQQYYQTQGKNEKGGVQNCILLQNILKFVKPPVFIIGTQFDTVHVSQAVNLSCFDYEIPTKRNCSSQRLKILDQVQYNITKIIKQSLLIKPQNGAWLISCAQHGLSYWNPWFSKDWRIPDGNNISLADAAWNWVTENGQPHTFIDEQLHWPNKKVCYNYAKNQTHMNWETSQI